MFEYIEPRVLLALSMLAVASFMDLKKREVHDIVWIIFGSIGAIMYLIIPIPDIMTILPLILVGSGITLSMAYFAYKAGLFGGADALAIAALTVIIPVYNNENMLHNIAPLTILTNACIFAGFSIPFNIIRNTIAWFRNKNLFDGFNEPFIRKMLAFMLGHRSNTSSSFAYLIEVETEEGKKFDFSLRNAEESEFSSRAGSWVMSGLPFIVYMLAGLVSMIIYGDILMSILSSITN